jgi:O-antigen/teichoic acid export membrane protein
LNPLKKLASQTIIYGLSSIVPRFLNYFLVPLHTHIFPDPAIYGIVGDLYALVVIFNIVLTYGMETAYFWFSKNEKDVNQVYSTSLISILVTSVTFIFVTAYFAQSIANYLEYPKHPEYIWWIGIILGVDAICAIPFVKLRKENKAMRFAMFKLINVLINVFFTICFLVVLPWINKNFISLPSFIYSPKIGIGYIFIANIIASVSTMVMLYKDFTFKFSFDFALWKRMLKYALPLLLAGFAGSINDAIDRQFIKYALPESAQPMHQLGIYFAIAKIAVILIVFVQTFRFAAEPFFFNYEKEKDSKQVFADIMKYFAVFCFVIFIATQGNMSIIKYMVKSTYWPGLKIVPIILLANVFVGIYLNLSIWYKLSGKTMYGAYIIAFGAAITIMINYLFVPRFGYIASAYARLACYISMTIVCYFLGQKNYRIPYNLKEISYYFFLSLLLLIPVFALRNAHTLIQLVVNNGLVLAFCYYILKREKLLPVLLNYLPFGKRSPDK